MIDCLVNVLYVFDILRFLNFSFFPWSEYGIVDYRKFMEL